jgi:soluble lytic murein transglycosylase-like protein
VFLRDIGQGLLEVSHNTLALLGLALAALALFAAGRADLRGDAEAWALGWLQARQEARAEPPEPSALLAAELSEPDAIARATASDPKELSRQQAAVAQWLSRRYHVAPEPVSRLVQEAWRVGQKASLDPTLILAIMAIESSFNPFAQSAVGAQGLMQVMTKVHNDKYEAFGGNHAAFDPVTNLRVGVQVLKECIARAGSLEAGCATTLAPPT